MNYRLDYGNQGDAKSPSAQLFGEMVGKIQSGSKTDLADLWKTDQLARDMRAQKAFLGFKEGLYDFPPTFKVKRNTGLEYTAQRSPAWCDRILTRSVPGFGLEQLSLSAARGVGTSDHKPVVSMFELSVPPTPPPLDRTLGDCVLRVHDIRCTLLRAPREKELEAKDLALAKDLDAQLVFLSSCLQKPVTTPVVKKTPSPQWLELPSAPATYNEIKRIKQCLLYARVLNHQSQDAIVGRAIISLYDLKPVPAEDGSTNTNADEKGRTQTKRFEVDFTYAGMPAGSISGQITVMWKAKAKK
jgi:hypothetical protein